MKKNNSTIKKNKHSKDKAKFYCNLIGCSGIRKECLNGDINCSILKPFFK